MKKKKGEEEERKKETAKSPTPNVVPQLLRKTEKTSSERKTQGETDGDQQLQGEREVSKRKHRTRGGCIRPQAEVGTEIPQFSLSVVADPWGV
jgi:hypothetical protein